MVQVSAKAKEKQPAKKTTKQYTQSSKNQISSAKTNQTHQVAQINRIHGNAV